MSRPLIVLLWIQRTPDGHVALVENVSGAKATAPDLPEAMAALAADMRVRYDDLAAMGRPWPHHKRALAQLARFFKEDEVSDDQRPVPEQGPSGPAGGVGSEPV